MVEILSHYSLTFPEKCYLSLKNRLNTFFFFYYLICYMRCVLDLCNVYLFFVFVFMMITAKNLINITGRQLKHIIAVLFKCCWQLKKKKTPPECSVYGIKLNKKNWRDIRSGFKREITPSLWQINLQGWHVSLKWLTITWCI